MVDVVFCLDDNFSMPTGITILSLLHYNTDYSFYFHIVSMGISEVNKQRLLQCIPDSSKLTFYEIDEELVSKLPVRENDHITLGTYLRLFLPTIIPSEIKTILYLDGDFLCVSSIKNLIDENISNYSAIVAIDNMADDVRVRNRLSLPLDYSYFNAGMMYINLDYWRKNNIQDETFNYIIQNQDKCIAHDQDGLNKILCSTLKFVSARYNMAPPFFYNYKNELIDKKYYNDLQESLLAPCLIHQWGPIKAWDKESNLPYLSIWRYFYRHSPWKYQKLKYKSSFKQLLFNKIRTIIVKNKEQSYDKTKEIELLRELELTDGEIK